MNEHRYDEAYLATKRIEVFETFCSQLRRNVSPPSNTYSLGQELPIDSDRLAFQLAGSLMENESLQTLNLQIEPGGTITNVGAHALGYSVQNSSVKSLNIKGVKNTLYPPEVTDCMWSFYSQALPSIQDLTVQYGWEDADAVRLGEMLHYDNVLSPLEKLLLRLDYVSEEGALALSDGIQSSNVSSLDLLDARAGVCRVLLTSGVMTLSTLRKFQMNRDILIFELDATLQDSSVFGNLSIPDATACLGQASKLESLQLNQCYLNDDDVKLLSAAIYNSQNLKMLSLFANNITDVGVASLAESCEGCLQLQSLNLGRNRIGAAGLLRLLEASSAHPSWQSLHVNHNADIGIEGFSSMDPSRVERMKLQWQLPPTLCLGACNLTDDDIRVLFSANSWAKANSTRSLKSLELWDNQIGDPGAAMLADCLNNGLLFETLDLMWCNQISAIGVQKLVRATLSQACGLKVLNVSGAIGYQGLAMICKDLPSSKLLKFGVCVAGGTFADVNSPGAKADRQACHEAAQALVNAVKANMFLQELHLHSMDIPLKAKNEIQFFLDLDKAGRQLLRLDDGLKPFGLWSHVLAKCNANMSVLFYLLGEQPMLIP